MDRVLVETVLNIFKVEQGNLKVLLFKDKGIWKLPSKLLEEKESLNDSCKSILDKFIGFSDLYLKQLTISNSLIEYNGSRVFRVSYLCLTDFITEKLKFKIDESLEYNWFTIDDIPNLENNEILNNTLDILKKEVENPNILMKLYPNDFTLPEIQKMLEKLLGINLDRRNFRKKLLVKDWIKETGKNSEPGNGRPGKLYTFNKNIEKISFY